MKAYELIDRPEKWTKEANCRDAHGLDVPDDDETAVCWCVYGAIRRCYGNDRWKYLDKVRDAVRQNPLAWNDTSDWKTVYETLKRLDI